MVWPRSSDLAKTVLQGTVKRKQKEEVDRSWNTILRGGQEWAWLAQQGQLVIGLG